MSVHLEVLTVLGKKITITEHYWKYIVEVKHPQIEGKEKEVIETLKHPREIRKSRRDPNTYLYYKKIDDKFICVICKHLNEGGFVITTYTTDRIKEGELVWKK